MAARDGLALIYGYEAAFPGDPASPGFLSTLWLWCQAARLFVARANETSQGLLTQVSARGARVSDGQDVRIWEFDVPETAFFRQRCVRMRGISVYPVGRTLAGAWQGYVVPPRSRRYLHPGSGERRIELTSSEPAYFGRATSWDPLRPSDVFGIVGLHNISPLGRWQVAFARTSTTGSAVSDVDDVLIDFHVLCA
jgi:hypothetical protein